MLVNNPYQVLRRRRSDRVLSSVRLQIPLYATVDEYLRESIAHQLQTLSVKIQRITFNK